jgi:hypothetical protein
MLQAYVLIVSDVCCKCFIWMFQKWIEMLHMLQWLDTYVASVCSKCFICFFIRMLQMCLSRCCICFHTYVASVLSRCCVWFAMIFMCFLQVFYLSSKTCCNCFIWMFQKKIRYCTCCNVTPPVAATCSAAGELPWLTVQAPEAS